MPPETYYAPPERASQDEFGQDVARLSRNPVVDGVMHLVGGLIAVLNEHRQVLAVNDTLLNALGVNEPDRILGLRPGEALSCVHAREMAAGCGTAESCASCGAVIAIMTSLQESRPVEKTCALRTVREGREEDLLFKVRSVPVEFDKRRYLLLFLQDITQEQQRASLERVFFHDIRNLITCLQGACHFMGEDGEAERNEHLAELRALTSRLTAEVEMQEWLCGVNRGGIPPRYTTRSLEAIFRELTVLFEAHPAARGKRLVFVESQPGRMIRTEPAILTRILVNMILNALEASGPGDEVRVWAEHGSGKITFNVKNRQVIPPILHPRVFQRNFTTKQGLGHGLGTYSMKLFGENYLCGKVAFTSTDGEGTVFRLTLPDLFHTPQ